MAESGYRHLSERQENDADPVSEPERQMFLSTGPSGSAGTLLSLIISVVSFMPVFPARSTGRTHVPAGGVDAADVPAHLSLNGDTLIAIGSPSR
jgi:hypothetical protein